MPQKLFEKDFILLDGGMGTMLQKRGLKAGELPELWNINHSDIIIIKSLVINHFICQVDG